MFGMGCFWGVERKFWKLPGVVATAVGYAGGETPNPTYQEVCTGGTGHNEVVLVTYDPKVVSYEALLKAFWEGHDPTQGMRQGNDVGHPVPLGRLRLHARAEGGGGGLADGLPGAAREGGARADHHRDRRRAGLLLRRGLPPAVPRQEPGRLLRSRRHWRELPDRGGGLTAD